MPLYKLNSSEDNTKDQAMYANGGKQGFSDKLADNNFLWMFFMTQTRDNGTINFEFQNYLTLQKVKPDQEDMHWQCWSPYRFSSPVSIHFL